jgi:hypothetical protein
MRTYHMVDCPLETPDESSALGSRSGKEIDTVVYECPDKILNGLEPVSLIRYTMV